MNLHRFLATASLGILGATSLLFLSACDGLKGHYDGVLNKLGHNDYRETIDIVDSSHLLLAYKEVAGGDFVVSTTLPGEDIAQPGDQPGKLYTYSVDDDTLQISNGQSFKIVDLDHLRNGALTLTRGRGFQGRGFDMGNDHRPISTPHPHTKNQ